VAAAAHSVDDRVKAGPLRAKYGGVPSGPASYRFALLLVAQNQIPATLRSRLSEPATAPKKSVWADERNKSSGQAPRSG